MPPIPYSLLWCAVNCQYFDVGRYGGKLVADSIDQGCYNHSPNDCVTGGTIMAVFFSVIMGSMALGQVSNASSNVRFLLSEV